MKVENSSSFEILSYYTTWNHWFYKIDSFYELKQTARNEMNIFDHEYHPSLPFLFNPNPNVFICLYFSLPPTSIRTFSFNGSCSLANKFC